MTPDSATYRYNYKGKHLTIPINKDHSKMVKFSRGDANLASILLSLAEMCSTKRLANGHLFSSVESPSQTSRNSLIHNTHVAPAGDDVVSWEKEEVLRDLGALLSSIEGSELTSSTSSLQ